MAKQFEATWSRLYQHPGTKLVGIDYFLDPEMNYRHADVKRISALEMGAGLEINGTDHTVKRVQDK